MSDLYQALQPHVDAVAEERSIFASPATVRGEELSLAVMGLPNVVSLFPCLGTHVS